MISISYKLKSHVMQHFLCLLRRAQHSWPPDKIVWRSGLGETQKYVSFIACIMLRYIRYAYT